MKAGLSRTRENLSLTRLFNAYKTIDDEFLDELEETLYEGDLGVEVTESLIESLKARAKRNSAGDDLKTILREEMAALFPQPHDSKGHKPEVILLVGVNGCGKTTTAGKLSQKYSKQGKKVTLAAADTFRAAAVEQLELWGNRTGARVVRQAMGADAASVAFDAMQSVLAKGEDVLIIDTAGRLHSKLNLMNELEKIIRVLKKLMPEAPHKVLLVLDAVIGQNAVEQARVFLSSAGVTGLVLTKLDGTARGGSALAVSRKFGLPIEYIGVGEQAEDLLKFDPEEFVKELIG